MAKFRFNQQFNVNRIVKRLVRTVIALYVGGTVISTFGRVMTNTSSPFYTGASLIGWTVGTQITNGTSTCYYTCANGGQQSLVNSSCMAGGTTVAPTNCITVTTGSGVLAVVGIIAIAQIITEFISW